MKRNRSIHSVITVVALVLGSAIAFAHNGVEHVLGTVKTVTGTAITVETVKHETSVIALDSTTTFTNKGVKALLKDLKVGDRVAIDTKDDASDKPHALTVKWGTSSATASSGTTKKGMPKATDHKMDPNMKM